MGNKSLHINFIKIIKYFIWIIIIVWMLIVIIISLLEFVWIRKRKLLPMGSLNQYNLGNNRIALRIKIEILKN
jgi:hypothetical protein